MKEKTKTVILLFFVCLVFIPSFIYGASSRRAYQMQVAASEKKLTSITVRPRDIELPNNADEQMLKEKLEVKASYKDQQSPEIITDYQTDFNVLKNKTGNKKVTISYTENGCTKKAKVCVEFVKLEENISTGEEDINFPYISGYPDRTFRPDQAVTREELATMLARLITKNQIPAERNNFTDLSQGRFSTDAINYITQLGIMSPVSADRFDPMGTVTANEFREIIDRANSYIKNKDVQLPEGMAALTRAQAVVALNQLFKVQCNTSYQTSPFTDVSESDPNYRAIVCATQNRR